MAHDEDEEFLCQLLKFHGAEALVAYSKANFQINSTAKDVEALVLKMAAAQSLFIEPFENAEEARELFSSFVGQVLKHIVDNSNNDFRFPEDETEEENLYGITPPPEYYLEVDEKTRRRMYYRSLERYDVLIGEVVQGGDLEDQYLVRLICFQHKRRMIDDLDLYMYIKKSDTSRLKTGDFVRGVFYDGNLVRRMMFMNFDYTHVKGTMSLGVITRADFPMYYKLMREAPVKTFDMLFEEKIIPQRNLNLMEAFDINPTNIFSFRQTVRNMHFPSEERLFELRDKRQTELCEYWVNKARAYYEEKNTAKSLSAFHKALKFNNDHIGCLLDRAAVYGNMLCFSYAVADLEHVLSLRPENEKAIDYYYDVLLAQADEQEKYLNYRGVFKSYKKILKIPAYENDLTISERLIMSAFQHYYHWPAKYEEVPEVQPEVDVSDDDSLGELLAKKEQLERQMQCSRGESESDEQSDFEEASTSTRDGEIDRPVTEEAPNVEKSSEKTTEKSSKKSHKHHHHRRRKHSESSGKKRKKKSHCSVDSGSSARVSRARRSSSPVSTGRKSRSLSRESRDKVSRSPSRGPPSRSHSPILRRERKSRSRSRGLRGRKSRSRSRGPWQRSRSNSRGPRNRRSRSSSRGLRSRRSRSSSRGLRSRRSRSNSLRPRMRRSRSSSRGLRIRRSRSSSRNPRNRRSRSVSRGPRSRRSRSNSRSRNRRSRSNSPIIIGSRRRRSRNSRERRSRSSSSPEVIKRSRPPSRYFVRAPLSSLQKSKDGSKK